MKTANIRNKKTSEERKGSAAAQESVAVIFIKKTLYIKQYILAQLLLTNVHSRNLDFLVVCKPSYSITMMR